MAISIAVIEWDMALRWVLQGPVDVNPQQIHQKRILVDTEAMEVGLYNRPAAFAGGIGRRTTSDDRSGLLPCPSYISPSIRRRAGVQPQRGPSCSSPLVHNSTLLQLVVIGIG